MMSADGGGSLIIHFNRLKIYVFARLESLEAAPCNLLWFHVSLFLLLLPPLLLQKHYGSNVPCEGAFAVQVPLRALFAPSPGGLEPGRVPT